MKKIRNLLITLVILIILIIAGGSFYINSALKSMGDYSEKVIFEVRNNASIRTVLSDLKDSGLIGDDNLSYYYIRFFKDVDFKAGTYELDKTMDFNSIVDYISDSRNAIIDAVKITFTEGEWLKHYALKIEEYTNVSYDDIMNYWNDIEILRELIDKYPFLSDDILNSDIRYPLEGYLFPNTYEFYRETTPEEITTKLLDETLKIYNRHEDLFKKSEMSTHEIFTLASIVQYEAAKAEDMHDIAGVFYNRMAISMPLQSSVTICYAMDIDKDTDWRQCEYNPDYDSPYNTYTHYGLTPGPILNPGESAIVSVLEPSNHDYYYFMADVCGDGKVYYSKTYEEHLNYVNRFLKCY